MGVVQKCACAKWPNDLKLSDRRLGRDACAVGGKAEVEAGGVTETPVRSSAWLGHSASVESIANPRPITAELTGDSRVTRNQKLASTKRMA